MKYWFHQKTYGYGFVPVSWEGWLATFVFILMLLFAGYANSFFTTTGPNVQQGTRFLLDILILSGLFTIMFEKKCKGGLKWRWGADHTKDAEDDV